MAMIPRLNREWGLSSASFLPSGENPNYNDLSSLALFSLILFPILSVISLTFVALRTGHNYSVERKLRVDDCKLGRRRSGLKHISKLHVVGFILIAVACATAQSVLDLTGEYLRLS